MKCNKILTGLLSAGILLSTSVAMAATPLSVSVHESRYVQEPGLSRVAIGSPEIADVQLLSGVSVGWQKNGFHYIAGLEC